MILSYIILGLLSYESMTGYDLKNFFNKSIYFFWTAELSQIYRELNKLDKLGYIESQIIHQENRPDKKVYSLTKDGEKAFLEWLNDFPIQLLPDQRNEFLVRIFFSSKIPEKDLIRQLENYIVQEEKELKKYQEIEKMLNEKFTKKNNKDHQYQRFTVRRGVITSEAALKWAKECLESLK